MAQAFRQSMSSSWQVQNNDSKMWTGELLDTLQIWRSWWCIVIIAISNAFICCVLYQLSVRGKNSKEKLSGFFRTVTQSVDEVLLSNQKDKDEFFDHQRTFLVEYFTRIKDATMKSDRMTKSHKSKIRDTQTTYNIGAEIIVSLGSWQVLKRLCGYPFR